METVMYSSRMEGTYLYSTKNYVTIRNSSRIFPRSYLDRLESIDFNLHVLDE